MVVDNLIVCDLKICNILSMRSDSEPSAEHADSTNPAFEDFDRRGYQATYVLSNALKYGAIFAVAGAILVAALPGLLLAPVAAIASIFSSSAGGAIASGVGAIAWTGALYGGGLGAAIGAAVGISGAGDAADAEEERRVELADRKMMRQDRVEQLRIRREQQRIAMDKQRMDLGLVEPWRGVSPGQRPSSINI
jgi:hypothetical protein